MHATDRVVLVASGFGVWQGGRHVASARWTDVARVRAFTGAEATKDLLHVAVQLRDGSEVLVQEDVPGFEQFLAAAEKRLPGMLARSSWRRRPAQPAGASGEVVLYERGGQGR